MADEPSGSQLGEGAQDEQSVDGGPAALLVEQLLVAAAATLEAPVCQCCLRSRGRGGPPPFPQPGAVAVATPGAKEW